MEFQWLQFLQRGYWHGNYDSVRSIFFTGIRASWFDPRCYGPKSWISDNDAILKQYIDELDQIASIMYYHDTYEYTRLKTMVHSYRHWRRNLALSCVAYFLFDIHNHGYDNSIIKQFGDRGLMNTPGILYNHASNFGHGIKYGYKGTKFVAKNYWNYIVKPLGKLTLGGWNYAFGSESNKAENEKKKIINPVNPNVVQAEQEPVTPKIEQQKLSNVVEQKNQPEKDPLAYLTAPSSAQLKKEFDNIERDIAQSLQPKVAVIDQKFIDKGDAILSLVKNNIHQEIADEMQEDYAVVKELAAECKAYLMQQEYDQTKPVELVDNVSLVNNLPSSTELIQEVAKDHNVISQPVQIQDQSMNDPYYVENPVIDLSQFTDSSQFSLKQWAIITAASFGVGAGIGHLLF
jgi:hypothetical protein